MKSNGVCAVVVTYNRKDLLLECLKSLREQTLPLDAIYIVDNASTDDTSELLLNEGYIKEKPPQELEKVWEREYNVDNLVDNEKIELHYVRMHKNTGGAGGFNEGMRRAYEKGFEWLWIMDDDSEPKNDALGLLAKHFEKKDILAFANTVKTPDGIILLHTRGNLNINNISAFIQNPLDNESYLENNLIDFASFVGLMINREIIKKVGLPEKNFFIHHDDAEYCLRIKKVSPILLVSDSIVFHKLNNLDEISEDNRRVSYDRLWILYYGRRNLIWLINQYSTNKLYFYYATLRNYLLDIGGIVLFDDHKYRRIHFFTESYLDGLKGKFDNNKPKRILYG